MTTELIFLLVSGLVAGLITAAGVFALLIGRRLGSGATLSPVGPGPGTVDGSPRDKYLALGETTMGAGGWMTPDRYRSTVGAAWWLVISGVLLIGVGAPETFVDRRMEIFVLGGLAFASVIFFHLLLPDRWRSPLVSAAEAGAAVALVSGLVLLTGSGSSPFAPLLALPVIGVALGGPPAAGVVAALAASAAYLGVLAADPARPFVPTEIVPAAIVLGLLWVATILAIVFAAQQRRLQAATLQLSVTDPLTGLFNRAQIYVDLDQEVRRSRRSLRPFCLLMVDMDGLKRINDTLGHERGDAAIRGIAGVIRRSIRTVDSAYRYAGDEFMVLLPETDFSGAFVVAEKIRQGAEEIGAALATEDAPTSVSIGLVSHPEDGSTDEELMLAVDRAMYAAKAAGKNQISGFPRPVRVPSPASGAVSGAVSEASALG